MATIPRICYMGSLSIPSAAAAWYAECRQPNFDFNAMHRAKAGSDSWRFLGGLFAAIIAL